MKNNIESNEFDKAKTAFLNEFGKQNPMEFWLDSHTYKLSPIKDEIQKANSIALADVQRVLDNWRKEAVTMSLVVTAPK